MTTSVQATSHANNIESSWLDVEHMTNIMQSAAGKEDWLHVVELAASRHQRLVEHFEYFPIGPDNAEFYRQRLSNMLSNEQSLQLVVREARKSLMREGMVVKHGHQAVGAYISNSI